MARLIVPMAVMKTSVPIVSWGGGGVQGDLGEFGAVWGGVGEFGGVWGSWGSWGKFVGVWGSWRLWCFVWGAELVGYRGRSLEDFGGGFGEIEENWKRKNRVFHHCVVFKVFRND